MRKILGCLRKAVEKFDMIQEDDRVAVGVSGGKDSLALLHALHLYRHFSPVKYELCALTLDMGFAGFDTGPLSAYCEGIGVDHHIVKTEIGPIIFDVRKEKNPCSLCARMRRGALHDWMVENDYNKLALGHHADDAIETLLMSLLYEGRLYTFQPVTYLSRKDITAIRPLIYATEKDIIGAVTRAELPVQKNPCPADNESARQEAKQMLKKLYKTHPQARDRIMHALENQEQTRLWF